MKPHNLIIHRMLVPDEPLVGYVRSSVANNFLITELFLCNSLATT